MINKKERQFQVSLIILNSFLLLVSNFLDIYTVNNNPWNLQDDIFIWGGILIFIILILGSISWILGNLISSSAILFGANIGSLIFLFLIFINGITLVGVVIIWHFGFYLWLFCSTFGTIRSYFLLKESISKRWELEHVLLDTAFDKTEIEITPILEKIEIPVRLAESIIFEMINKRKLQAKYNKEEKILIVKQQSISDAVMNFDKLKNRLFGMIQAYERLNLSDAAKIINIPIGELKNLLYDLIGEKKVLGKIDGDEFIISSDIHQFIELLDNQFNDWKHKENNKMDKI